MEKNILWHKTAITREQRENLLKQKAALVWLTGLSGAGKSTIATALQKKLFEEKKLAYILDGDNVRHGLNNDLGFSAGDRAENIRRVGEVAKLMVDAGIITLTSFISPYRKDRDNIRKKMGSDFIEVFVKCSIGECERRDTKGLYEKARNKEVMEFTGISAPYEEPEKPEIVLDTEKESMQESVQKVYGFLKKRGIV